MSSSAQSPGASPGLGLTAFDEPGGEDSPNIFTGDSGLGSTGTLDQPSVFAEAGSSQILTPSITDDELLQRK